jgi:glycosyltransferase involved in cell wall biosynthesis
MVRDEDDIIAQSVGWMMRQVDHVIVADNGSTDGTRAILDSLDVTVVDDPEVGYFQSRKMSALAEMARVAGADWVVPFDADEIHVGVQKLADLPDDVLICEAALFDHVATGRDADEPNPVYRMTYRRQAQAPLRKVAVRTVEGVVIHQGNHGASFPGVKYPKSVTNMCQVRHFPYRSVEQFVKKVRNGAAAYAATDLPPEAGAHWRQYGQILEDRGVAGIEEIFRTWFYRENPLEELVIHGEHQPALVFDPCPR